MTVVGGLRARLIHDAAFDLVRNGVEELGWTDANRRHRPVTFRARAVEWDEEVPFNTISVSQTDHSSSDAEMGSNLTEERWTFYVDLYAEDDSVGTHLIHDIRDVLRGKMPSIGRDRPIMDILDRTQATPVSLFICDIENVIVDRANDFPKSWQKHWYVIRFEVVDAYGDETDT